MCISLEHVHVRPPRGVSAGADQNVSICKLVYLTTNQGNQTCDTSTAAILVVPIGRLVTGNRSEWGEGQTRMTNKENIRLVPRIT